MPKDGYGPRQGGRRKGGDVDQPGANFDGEAEDVALGKLRPRPGAAPKLTSKIVINKPTRTETVSFTRDIARLDDEPLPGLP